MLAPVVTAPGPFLVAWWEKQLAMEKTQRTVTRYLAEQRRLRSPPVDGAAWLCRVVEYAKQGV